MKRISQRMDEINYRTLFIVLLIVWMGLNFIQALGMEVMSDETYYYLYGRHLAWGYFDHPPMVGLMTWLSAFFFDGNLSVRFITIILHSLTLVFIWKIIEEKQPDSKKTALFFIITFSIIMFQIYGFITSPDVPFLFFSALFILCYRNFLRCESWANTLLLALSMTGMIYSKYHAFLLIGCIIASNIRLLAKPKCWAAVLLMVLLLSPHIYWQVSMDFPSIKYHLIERSSGFKWHNFITYLPNQLVIFNPLTFGAVVYIILKKKMNDLFDRGLFFIIIGVFFFFWLMTFKGHVEPHWTVVCAIPMAVLLYRHSLLDAKLNSYVFRWILPSLLVLFIIRIIFLTELVPEEFGFYGEKDEVEALESIAGPLPVVFTGSYQNPSDYHFFAGKESFVLSAVNSRQTQYDIWQNELKYHGKPVFIAQEREGKSVEYQKNGKRFYGYTATQFQSVNRLKILYSLTQADVCPGDTLRIDFELFNPTPYDINFQHDEFPVTCKAAYAYEAKIPEPRFINCTLNRQIELLPANATLTGSLNTIVPDLTPAEYFFALTLDNTICCAYNSHYVRLKIKK